MTGGGTSGDVREYHSWDELGPRVLELALGQSLVVADAVSALPPLVRPSSVGIERRRALDHDRIPCVDGSSANDEVRAPNKVGLAAGSVESMRGPSSSAALSLIADRRRAVNSLKSIVREW